MAPVVSPIKTPKKTYYKKIDRIPPARANPCSIPTAGNPRRRPASPPPAIPLPARPPSASPAASQPAAGKPRLPGRVAPSLYTRRKPRRWQAPQPASNASPTRSPPLPLRTVRDPMDAAAERGMVRSPAVELERPDAATGTRGGRPRPRCERE
jgi:hypothetical protein